jgi:protoporphyrinogen oxidase
MTDTSPTSAPASGTEITAERPVIVLGGGPAGLTAGYLLAKQGKPVIVLEASDMVGGIARTEVRDGYRFDLGGHRFFTKVKEVDDLWHEIMKEEFLRRPRKSRIYYHDKFWDYPLQAGNVIRNFGPVELVRVGLSYVWAVLKPKGREDTFEQWVSNRFGKRLFNHFFKTYTEKLWGVSTDEIRAEWAAQRIKGLSFLSAAKAAFLGNKDNKIKSLISEFNYPRYGPGQMWEQMTADIRAKGGEVRLNAPVTRLRTDANGRVTEVIAGGETLTPSHVISSLPLRTTVGITEPEAPADVRDAARGLRYREFLTVLLVIEGEDLFDDNWIYIHQPGVRVLRIQNFKSWSPWMVPNDKDASIGMEYFCFEGDDLWNMADDDLVKMAGAEIEKLHLARADKVKFGFVARVHKAYPIYDVEYAERVATIRKWLETVPNLIQVGRNGLHRYNNSDHSMLTAMRAVDNILLGTHHDIWAVNAESVYHEEHEDPEQPYRDAPETPAMEQPLASER